MGFLSLFAKSKPAAPKLVAGSFTVDRQGRAMTTTIASGAYSQALLDETAREVLSLFRSARAARMPLAGLDLHYAGLHIKAREMQSGAIIYLSPQNPSAAPAAATQERA